MDQDSRTDDLEAQDRRRLLLVLVPSLVVLVAVAVFAALAPRTRSPAPPHGVRQKKLGLIKRLPAAPELVIFGGSRALHYDPSYIEAQTGLRGFNAAVPQSRPKDAWAFLRALRRRFPNHRIQCLWVIQVEEFDRRPPDGLATDDPRVSPRLPAELVTEQPAPRQGTATPPPFKGAVFGADGSDLHDGFDSRPQTDAALGFYVQATVQNTLRQWSTAPPALDRRSCLYFEKTLQQLDRSGVTPVVVLSPVQPHYLADLCDRGWDTRHQMVLAYLGSLDGSLRFRLFDFSRVASCGASPSGFYDGVHPREETTQRVVDAVLAADPQAFGGGAPVGGEGAMQ